MTFKIAFKDNTWRTITADCFTHDGELLVFPKDEKPILTRVLQNVFFWEAVEAPAEAPFRLK